MFPSFSNFRLSDCTLGYAKGFSYLSLSSRILSDSYYGGIGQFCPRFLFPKELSLFLATIIRVILLGAKKKMAMVYARGDVTFMKYAKTIWNRTYIQFPRYSMSKNRSLIANLPISFSIYRPRPQPAASIGFRSPKTIKSALRVIPSDAQIVGFSLDSREVSMKYGRKIFFGFRREISTKDFFLSFCPVRRLKHFGFSLSMQSRNMFVKGKSHECR